ncbi:hypothetical protein PF001_g28685 [Phytophthora fragariae]|uniref:Reverse transcriptase domain-containing protein n=1 Tax=Phytophthora fragariae TaxID=53985 RepID=A0A6A4B872_9STRA|nr:hypothetical protein PF001_g28685 [Phytophthora fragariae]
MEEEARSEVRCPQCHYPETYPPTPSSTSRFTPEERRKRARELVLELTGVLGDSVLDSVLTEITKGYGKEARLVRRKRLDRLKVCWCHRSADDEPDRSPPVRRVRFDHTSLSADRSEALGLNVSYVENEDDVLNYVCIVRDPSDPPGSSKPGLVEVPDDSRHEDPSETDAKQTVPDGKRVICSVGGFEAISGGTIADRPAELLVDTGAIASLVDARVLKQIGLANAPLRPYEGSLNGVTGFPLKIRGEIDLPLRLGVVTRSQTFAVVEKLHVHAILGTDTLKDFRAVIDVEEGLMMLKGSGESIPLGTPRVEETYVSRVASTVRLCPGGQALVVANVMGRAPENATVLIEGLPELDPLLKVARTLCSVQEGQTIVEICNTSHEDLVIRKGTALAAATVVPDSAFSTTSSVRTSSAVSTHSDQCESQAHPDLDAVIGAVVADKDPPKDPMPGLDEAYQAELDADFTDSKLGDEQQGLLRSLLGDFRDMFVESSLKPGRTDLLEFSIDTGAHPPIKQRPYRVSNAEGDVMEAEIQQYLELGIVRPSTSPWASPVLMIRKPDGGIRFCIDYRRLNAVTIKDCYPMPLIDDILDVLRGAKLFSTMDIASGYWNVPMHAGSVEKTAFTCKYGLFEWLVMPFGLCNAVPAFERLMENVLVDLKWRTCLVYLDDCVVFSTDFPTHLVRLRQVLERFRAAGFKLKMKKCRWGA